jgi:EpsI family protein
MMPSRRKALIVAASMAAAAALAQVGVPTEKIADRWTTDLPTMFPAAFTDWRVDESIPVVLPAPDVQASLNRIYNQVLARTYVNRRTGERVMLSVAYGGDQSDGMQAHLPEVCYPSQGFELYGKRQATLMLDGRTIPAQRIRTRMGARHEPVTYWLTLGETVAATRTDRKIQQMRYGLRGLIPDGMLVRVSTIDRDAEHAFAVQDDFLRALAVAIPEAQRARVLGARPA